MATKQQYATCPAEVEVYRLGEQTDVILRKTIREVEKTEERDGETVTYTVYECEERQFRYPGKLSQGEVEKDFDNWWDWEPEAENTEDEVTEEDRIAALEAAVLELAEVITGG